MSELRLKRVESFLEAELGRLISSGTLHDPRIDSLVTITGVQVARDLAAAKVFVSHYGDAQVLSDAVDGLNHAAGFIQSAINPHLRMRNTPKLRFIADPSLERGFRIIQQLKDIGP